MTSNEAGHGMLTSRRAVAIAFAVLFVLHALISFQGIGEVFLRGHQGFAGSLRASTARNYVRYGLAETGLRPYRHHAPDKKLTNRDVHWHHPPGLALMVAASYSVFGLNEAATRLVPIVFSLISFVLLFLIVRRRHGPGAALLAVACFALLPMQIEYGNHVSYGVPITTFILLGLYLLERLRAEEEPPPRRRWYVAGIVAAACAAGFVDWVGFIGAAFLGLDALLRRPRRPWVFVTVGVVTTALLGGLLWWLGGIAGGSDAVMNLAEWRSSGGKTSVGDVLDRSLERLVDFFGWVPILTSLGWLVVSDVKRRLDPVIFVFGGTQLVYALAFKQATVTHIFYLYFLGPAVAVACALAVSALYRKVAGLERRGAAILAAVVVVGWFGAYGGEIGSKIAWLHGRSYKYNPKKKGKPPKLPRAGGLDRVLVAKLIRERTDEDDVVAFHKSVNIGPRWRHYMYRRDRRTRSKRPPMWADFYVARRRAIPRKLRRELAKKHAVIQTMGFLIVDPDGEPGLTRMRYREKPMTAWHWYFVSAFYPPHELQ